MTLTMLGVKPILCQTYPEAAFVLFLECRTPLITPKTKATSLVLVAPNNSVSDPTTSFLVPQPQSFTSYCFSSRRLARSTPLQLPHTLHPSRNRSRHGLYSCLDPPRPNSHRSPAPPWRSRRLFDPPSTRSYRTRLYELAVNVKNVTTASGMRPSKPRGAFSYCLYNACARQRTTASRATL